MIPGKGRPLLAALFLVLPAVAMAAEGRLLVVDRQDRVLAELPLPDGVEACLSWHHSVTGGPVADCFAIREGRLVLTRSYLHDYAAGLGEVPGRGTVRPAAEGGYWIDDIDEPLPADGLTVRIGPAAVGHRLRAGAATVDLSALAAGQRLRLSAHSP